MILCYKCGIPTEPKLHSLCQRCTSMSISNVENIRRALVVEWCKGCERYLNKPRTWNKYDWGSRELLIYLIKCNSTLNRHEIVDSNFVYTEEHSKRMIVSVTIENEGVRETTEIRYTIRNKQCQDCEKIEAKQHWKAIVQIRHRPKHPRIFIQLEQLILKNKMYNETTNIKMRKEGFDFYFVDRTNAAKIVDFIESVMPVKVILSERLVSKDVQNSRDNYKFSYSVEIAPLCVDDVLVIEKSFAASLGCSNVVIVKKVSNTIVFTDFNLLKTIKVSNQQYWNNKDKFNVLISSASLTTFEVVEIDKPLSTTSEYKLVPVTLTKNDFSVIEAKTHLGKSIKEGDTLLGYDLTNFNCSHMTDGIPDTIIIRKNPFKDVKWKIKGVTDEHYYYLDDSVKDKEIVNNLCEMSRTDELLLEQVATLLN